MEEVDSNGLDDLLLKLKTEGWLDVLVDDYRFMKASLKYIVLPALSDNVFCLSRCCLPLYMVRTCYGVDNLMFDRFFDKQILVSALIFFKFRYSCQKAYQH